MKKRLPRCLMSPRRPILLSLAAICLAVASLTAGLVSLAQPMNALTRLTVASANNRQNLLGFAPGLSADGSVVAFAGDSDFFNEGIPDEAREVWLYDTVAMTVTRLTTGSISGRESLAPSPNADGSKIVFRSDADLLNQGIPAGQSEIWLYDTTTMTLTRITSAPTFRSSFFPVISGDGRWVAFESDADFLGQGIQQNQLELWLYDTLAMTLTRITTATAPDLISVEPAFNSDASLVAFASRSDLLNEGGGSQYQIWLYNRLTRAYTRISPLPGFNRDSRAPSLNADGTKVVFYSDSDFLGQGVPNEQNEIWLYDTQAMTITRITTASSSERDSFWPRLSADGTKVVFYSDADFLGQGLIDNQNEIWLYDTQTMTVTRLTSTTQIGRENLRPNISADGKRIAFYGDADFFNEGIADNQLEIWLYEVAPELHLTLDDASDPVRPGQTLTYTISIFNNGGDAPDALLRAAPDSRTNVVAVSGGGQQVGGEIIWSLGTITRGHSLTHTLAVTVNTEPGGPPLTATVSLTSARGGLEVAIATTSVSDGDIFLYLPLVTKR